ncbi:MAG: hypothetical protein Q7R95_01995 [bacterium]|nr:hypothetical protein [bacterium]
MIKLPVEIIVISGKGNDSGKRSVILYCPLRCGFKSQGDSLSSVQFAFEDALESSSEGLHRHLRQFHRNEILEYDVENDYVKKIKLLKQLLPK